MKSRSLLSFYFIICIIITAVAVIYLFSIPADPKNQLLFGLSLPRLVVASGFLAFAAIMVYGLLKNRRDPDWSDSLLGLVFVEPGNYSFAVLLCLSGAALGWYGSFIPVNAIPALEAYLLRIKPVLFWLTAIFLLALFFLAYARKIYFSDEQFALKPGAKVFVRKWILYSAIAFGLLLLTWLFIKTSGVGLVPVSFWQKTGVPLLSRQVFWVWAGGFFLFFIAATKKKTGLLFNQTSSGRDKTADILLFLLLWAAGAILWNLQPLPHSHFAPGPYPPDFQNYPYSDAAVYDTCAEFALIGQGLCNLQYADKPLYSFFLLVLHLVAGNRFDILILLQVSVLALIPSILYLLGAKIFNRLAGIIIAVLAIYKGINSISGTLVIWDISNPKFIMSEVPMLFMLALFTYFLVIFSQEPARNTRYLLLAGGTLGLATLIRHNAWFLFPFGLLIPFFLRGFPFKLRGAFSLLFLGVFVLSTLPWMVRSAVVNHNPFYVVIPFRGLVTSDRLEQIPSADQSVEEQVQETRDGIDDRDLRNEITIADAIGRIVQNLSPIASHFFHNLVTSVFTLPPTIQFVDLSRSVGEGSPFWERYWDGSMNFVPALMATLNAFILSFGLGFSFSRWRWTGMLPLFVFLLYAAGNALAKTSGGRYIVPMDWAVYFYYGIGVAGMVTLAGQYFGFQLDETNFNPPFPRNKFSERKNINLSFSRPLVYSTIALVMVGTIIPLADIIFPQKYSQRPDVDWIDELYVMGVLDPAVDASGDAARFLGRKDVVVIHGKMMYPRYVDPANELSREIYNYLDISEPEMVFQVINAGHPDYKGGEWLIRMPVKSTPSADQFPAGVDTIIIGCVSEDSILALVTVLDPGGEKIVYRPNLSALSCPAE